MQPTPRIRIVAWIATVLFAALLAATVVYVPIVAALIFVSLLVIFSIGVGQEKEKWKGIAHFVKEILFGW